MLVPAQRRLKLNMQKIWHYSSRPLLGRKETGLWSLILGDIKSILGISLTGWYYMQMKDEWQKQMGIIFSYDLVSYQQLFSFFQANYNPKDTKLQTRFLCKLNYILLSSGWSIISGEPLIIWRLDIMVLPGGLVLWVISMLTAGTNTIPIPGSCVVTVRKEWILNRRD